MTAPANRLTMRAIVQDAYGDPSRRLNLRDVPVPEIGDDGVLVRVRAASVNALDWHAVRGEPFIARLDGGLRKPKAPTPGVDVSGVVEAVGADVTELAVGDEVFGARNGSFAEVTAGRVRNFVRKPAQLTFEGAAAIPVAATTALQALRDQAGVLSGQDVLIIGAAGGVGSFAVQIAKAFGARVTATTRASRLELVTSLGADAVIDDAIADERRLGRRFDAVLDVGGYRPLRDLARIVAPDGVIVAVGAGRARIRDLVPRLLTARLRSRFRDERIRFFLARTNRPDLQVLADLAADGKLVPVIDRVFPLAEAGVAIEYVERGEARGKVIIEI